MEADELERALDAYCDDGGRDRGVGVAGKLQRRKSFFGHPAIWRGVLTLSVFLESQLEREIFFVQ